MIEYQSCLLTPLVILIAMYSGHRSMDFRNTGLSCLSTTTLRETVGVVA